MAAVVADVVGFGPTTRKQWKEYVEGSNKIKKVQILRIFIKYYCVDS